MRSSREFQALLKAKDPGFGGLVRVMNKRQEFLWVHPQFERRVLILLYRYNRTSVPYGR